MTSLEDFTNQAGMYDIIPLVLEMDMGEETPLSIYRKLSRGKMNSFLLESGHRKEKEGRYSFIGVDPERIFRVSITMVILSAFILLPEEAGMPSQTTCPAGDPGKEEIFPLLREELQDTSVTPWWKNGKTCSMERGEN